MNFKSAAAKRDHRFGGPPAVTPHHRALHELGRCPGRAAIARRAAFAVWCAGAPAIAAACGGSYAGYAEALAIVLLPPLLIAAWFVDVLILRASGVRWRRAAVAAARVLAVSGVAVLAIGAPLALVLEPDLFDQYWVPVPGTIQFEIGMLARSVSLWLADVAIRLPYFINDGDLFAMLSGVALVLLLAMWLVLAPFRLAAWRGAFRKSQQGARVAVSVRGSRMTILSSSILFGVMFCAWLVYALVTAADVDRGDAGRCVGAGEVAQGLWEKLSPAECATLLERYPEAAASIRTP